MEVLLPRTDTAIADCQEHFQLCAEHLPGQGYLNPAVSAYLTRHVAVLLCAEVESVVTSLVFERVDKCGDIAVANFVKSVRGNIVRNAKFAEIGDKLGLLGPEVRAAYEKRVSETIGQDGIERLGTAVGKRDSTAHTEPPDITFDELIEAYKAAQGLVDAVRIALNT